jgi:putative DNA binding protein
VDKIGHERLLLQDHVCNIMNWSTERGIDKCSSKKQLYKIVEEVGELTSAYLKNDLDKFMDAIGDVFIAITIFCQQESLKVMEFYYPAEYCADFNQALNRISPFEPKTLKESAIIGNRFENPELLEEKE